MKPLLASLLAALLTGCTAPAITSEHRDVYVKPAMILVTADQAAARGLELAPAADPQPPLPPDVQPADARSVIAPADVKVYTVNRSTDPADREILHEQHVIYRRETTPAWRMQAPADQKILIGPRVTDGREELQPVLSKELVAFLTEQRRATEANQKAVAALFQAVDRLNSAAARPAPSAADEGAHSPAGDEGRTVEQGAK